MNYLDAATSVLRRSARPLTTREIAEAAIEKGLLTPHGKTPAASMSAALYTYIHREPNGPIERLFTPGRSRAARGSVRWQYRKDRNRSGAG